MKRLAMLITAVAVSMSAIAGPPRGYPQGQHYGGPPPQYRAPYYNGWTIAGAFVAGAAVATVGAYPYYPYYPYPVVQYPQYPAYYEYPPQQVIVCVQSGNSPYYQQGNCFTPQYPR